MKTKNIWYLGICAVLISAMMLLCGCAQQYSGEGEYTPPSGGHSESTETQTDPEIPEESQDDPESTAIPSAEPAEGEPESKALLIRVESLNVFIDDQQIDYDHGDLESLRTAVMESLSSVPQDMQILLDFYDGDNSVCSAIERTLKEMGLSAAEYAD